MDISLTNKTAVICGSSQGIGLAAAISLAELGATCILIARNPETLHTALQQLPVHENQQHQYAVADFSDVLSVEQAIKDIVKNNQVSILVNNSGGPQPGPITAASAKDFEDAFKQHLICNQILTNAVLPAMKTAGNGRIINVISTSIKSPLPNLGVSNTIRAAVASWAKTLANEIGRYNITVNNVLPGLTDTARYQKLLENSAKNTNRTTAEVDLELINTIPLLRIAKAKEVADVIAFLASPAASYISGTSIPVDGGRTAAL